MQSVSDAPMVKRPSFWAAVTGAAGAAATAGFLAGVEVTVTSPADVRVFVVASPITLDISGCWPALRK